MKGGATHKNTYMKLIALPILKNQPEISQHLIASNLQCDQKIDDKQTDQTTAITHLCMRTED